MGWDSLSLPHKIQAIAMLGLFLFIVYLVLLDILTKITDFIKGVVIGMAHKRKERKRKEEHKKAMSAIKNGTFWDKGGNSRYQV